MKSKFLILVFSILMMEGCTPKKFKIPAADVPQVVVTNFQQKYPDAQVVEWEAEKETGNLVYEVGFKVGDKKMEAAFKSDGSFIQEE